MGTYWHCPIISVLQDSGILDAHSLKLVTQISQTAHTAYPSSAVTHAVDRLAHAPVGELDLFQIIDLRDRLSLDFRLGLGLSRGGGKSRLRGALRGLYGDLYRNLPHQSSAPVAVGGGWR